MGLLLGLSNLAAYPSAWSIREVRQKEFWDAVGSCDPLPYWQEVDVKALVLYGELDSNVPSAESAARLRALHKENIAVRIYEGSGHPLEDPPGQGNDLIREDVLRAVRDFIFSIE
jgi:pimeloyl-ACP methyl ester carboxylesterase